MQKKLLKDHVERNCSLAHHIEAKPVVAVEVVYDGPHGFIVETGAARANRAVDKYSLVVGLEMAQKRAIRKIVRRIVKDQELVNG